MTDAANAGLARAYVWARRGRGDAGSRVLQALACPGSAEGASPYLLAMVRFRQGDNDRGFELLEEACRRHDRYILLIGIEKDFAGVRSDPRYKTMLRKIGLAGHLRP